jgi:hypothetical protein
VYEPERRLGSVYTPASFVITEVTTPVALFVPVTDTPGSTAPLASVTLPLTVA